MLVVILAEPMIIKKLIIRGLGHGRIQSPNRMRLSIKSKCKGLWVVVLAELVIIEKPVT